MNFKLINLLRFTFTIALLIITIAQYANANPDTVANTSNSGIGSLRNTVSTASSGDTIVFSPSLLGDTIKLFSPIILTNNVSIFGLGRDSLFVDGLNGSRIFSVLSGDTITIQNLALINGFAPDSGGAIYNAGVLSITSCVIRNSTAAHGGGILNKGSLTLANNLISGNTATGYGGGIFNQGGGMGLTNTFIEDNTAVSGGGIAINGASSTSINTTTIEGNSADVGGGIFNASTITLSGSSIIGNTADSGDGGGIHTEGNTKLTNCEVSGNHVLSQNNSGGGISNDNIIQIISCSVSGNTSDGRGAGISNSPGGSIITVNSCISGNTADLAGGGFLNHGELTITNSTISGNNGSTGGGIWNDENIQINNSTIAFNAADSNGGGIWNTDTLRFKNTIVGSNTAAQTGPEIFTTTGGISISQGYNLVRNILNAGFTPIIGQDIVGTTATPKDPLLKPLQNNGGTTLTHDLNCESPAIDAGDPQNAPAADQRGLPRIKRVIDIGSVESEFDVIIITPVLTYESSPGAMDGKIQLDVNGGVPPYYFEWDPTGDSTQNLIGIPASNYSVTDTDFTGCEQSRVIALITGIENWDFEKQPLVYPNPFQNNIFIDASPIFNSGFTIKIMSIVGSTLLKQELANSVKEPFELNVNRLENGIYFMELCSQKKLFLRKIVKTE